MKPNTEEEGRDPARSPVGRSAAERLLELDRDGKKGRECEYANLRFCYERNSGRHHAAPYYLTDPHPLGFELDRLVAAWLSSGQLVSASDHGGTSVYDGGLEHVPNGSMEIDYWDGTRTGHWGPCWVLDNMIVGNRPSPSPPPLPPPTTPRPAAPLPGIGGVGAPGTGLFAPFEPQTAEEAAAALEIIQTELLIIGAWLNFGDYKFGVDRVAKALKEITRRTHGLKKYTERVVEEMSTKSGHCVDELGVFQSRLPGSVIESTCAAGRQKMHYWLRLADGRVADPSLRANLLDWGVTEGLPPVGQKIFTPSEHAQYAALIPPLFSR